MGLFRLFKFRRRGGLERQGPASKKRANAPATRKMRRPVFYRLVPVLVVVMVWVIGDFAILYRTQRSTIDLGPGMKSPVDVNAQVDFAYEDEAETRALQEREKDKVLDLWRIDMAAKEETLRDYNRLFDILNTPATEGATPATPSEGSVRQLVGEQSEDDKALLRSLFSSQEKRSQFLDELNDVLLRGIVSSDKQWLIDRGGKIQIVDELDRKRPPTDAANLLTPENAANELLRQFAEREHVQLPDATRQRIVDGLLGKLIYPNLTFDAKLRQEAIDKAVKAVQPVKRQVKKQTIFIDKGQIITTQDVIKLKAHEEALKNSADLRQEVLNGVSLLLLSLALVVIAAIYLNQRQPQVVAKNSHVLLIGLIACINILTMWATEELMLWLQPGTAILLYPALPLTLGSLLLALLLGRDVGLTAAVFLSAICALISDQSLQVFNLSLVTSIVGVIAIHKSRTRIRTFRAALWIALSAAIIESIYLLFHATPAIFYLMMIGIALASAFVTVLLVNLLLPLFEFAFRLTTNISLLELSDLNHPLLKRLQLEAPGTYHHTLMVATLAEHAAEAVGANTLLTRVACYFHDIGKLANPTYFTENSFGENRHEELSPRMSSMIILNHVKEGLAMAAKYKLKEPIREAIATHHGTSLVYFFYRRALDDNQIADASDEECFRYPGPAPQSREATIISLADSCEAASRSLEKPTPQKIDALVNELFHNKLLTGQLDESQLSMAELKVVITTIKRTLQTMLHGRVSYPKFTTAEGGEPPKKVAGRRPQPAEQAAEDGAGGDPPEPAAEPAAEPDRGESGEQANDRPPE